jgi:anti-anti-sigma regulatory factor
VIQRETNRRGDGSVEVALKGKIDERFEWADLVEATRSAPKVVVHLGGVRAISSLGIRTLEGMVLGLVGETTRPVELVHVPPALATQLAMIPNLCQGAVVRTAELPFVCPACTAEKTHEVPWRAHAHVDHAPTCDCGQKMELDGLPEQYLPPP